MISKLLTQEYRLICKHYYDIIIQMSVIEIVTYAPEETIALGEQIGRSIRGGEVFELVSDLGGGKTTLTKGIATGLGSTDLVSSPTFTVSNVYTAQAFTVHHYDFYRLLELGLMSEELQETLSDPKCISIIEWAGEAHDLLPKEKLIRIAINPLAKDESARSIKITSENQQFLDLFNKERAKK